MTQRELYDQTPILSMGDNSQKLDDQSFLHDLLTVQQIRVSLLLNSPSCLYNLWRQKPCRSRKFKGFPEICKLFISWVLTSILLELPEC